MNMFHIFFLIIIGAIFGKSIHIFWELIFIHKKINYYFYFFISAVASTGFLITDFILSLPLREEYYQIIFRFLFLSIIIAAVSWCFLFYRLYFKKSILPWIFLGTSLLILFTLPFKIFMTYPTIVVKNTFFGSQVLMHYPYPGIMFYICEINIFIFFTISIFVFLKSKLKIKQKIIGSAAFLPGILFLSDTILFLMISKNYPDITYSGSIINIIIICIFLFVIFLFPNFQNYFEIQDKLDKMKIKNKELEEEVKNRTKEIENKNKQQTNLFINLTHEIKTPLTLIKNYLESYINENCRNKKINLVKSSVDKLTVDINNFFDMQKFELNKDVYKHNEIINFSKIISESILLFTEYAQKMNCKIKTDISKNIYIKASVQAVDRIINNLLDNAVKYSGNPGWIHISLKRQAERIILKIKNNGESIDKEKHKKIFEPYYQILKPKTNIQGMGMGLSIVKKIVDSLDGFIKVESLPDKYTEFIINLKSEPAPDEFFNNDYSLSKPNYFDENILFSFNLNKINPDKKTLLIVEDNKSLLSFLIENLKEQYNILFAFNGNQGIEKYSNNTPDLVISDVMMDGMDGFTFYDNILKSEHERYTPFLFITAKSDIEDRLKGLGYGAVDYICKPFNINELKLKIKSILNYTDGLKALSSKEITNKVLSALGQENITGFKKSYAGSDSSEININKIFTDYRFSNREKEVFISLIDGKINKEIASILNLSVSSIKKYIFNIYKKLGVNNRIELSNFLYNNYLVFTKK